MLEIRSQKAVCGSVLGYLITTHSIPAAAHLSLNWFAKCHVLLGYAIPLQPSSVGEEHGMEPQFMYPVCTLWNCSFYHFTVRLLAHPSWHYLTWIKRIYSTLYYTIHCHTVFEKNILWHFKTSTNYTSNLHLGSISGINDLSPRSTDQCHQC